MQPWLNVPDLGSSVLVYGHDPLAAAQLAGDTAGVVWDQRRRFFEFPMRGQVTWTGGGAFRCEGPQWHGKVFRAGRAACVRAGTHRPVYVVLTERPCFVWGPGFYCKCMAQLDVRDAHVVVVKSAGAYRAAFKGIASRSISVDGPGASPSNLLRIEPEMTRVRRPLYLTGVGFPHSRGRRAVNDPATPTKDAEAPSGSRLQPAM